MQKELKTATIYQEALGVKKMNTLRELKNELLVLVRSNFLLKKLVGVKPSNDLDHTLKMQVDSTSYDADLSQVDLLHQSTNKKNRNSSVIEECLRRMPELQRNVFVYKTFEGLETSLICAYFNIDEAVFWKNINQARNELSTSLEIS